MIGRAYKRVTHFWWGQGLAYDVPSLAFYLLVSLAPLALGLAALAGILFADLLEPDRVAEVLADRFPDEIRERIISLAASSKQQTAALLLSISLMIWTSSAALGVLERAMTRVSRAEPFGILWGRIRLLGFGTMFALLVVSALAVSTRAAGFIPFQGGALALAALSIYGGCLLLYLTLPHRRPRTRAALLGALPGAGALLLCPYLVSLYLSIGRVTFGGIFALVVILLISTYLMATGLIIGAGLAARPRADLDSIGDGPKRENSD